MRRFIATLFFLIPGLAFSATVNIDFEDQTLGEVVGFDDIAEIWFGSGTLEVDGFTFSAYGGDPFQGCCAEGSILTGDNTTQVAGIHWSGTSLDGFGPETTVSFERADGTDFSLLDMDYFADSSGSFDLTVVGYLDGAAVASSSTAFGTGGWLNVDAVTLHMVGNEVFFEGFALEIDNISANVVPIPAAVWLFASALGLLGWRKQAR